MNFMSPSAVLHCQAER